MNDSGSNTMDPARWNLELLVNRRGPAGAVELLTEANELASAFAARYQDGVAELDAEELATALREMAEICEISIRATEYAFLRFAEDTTDEERGALLQRATEMRAELDRSLLAFVLELIGLEDEWVEALLASDELDFCRHYLRAIRRYRPHKLSVPEERIITELEVSGVDAFRRLWTMQASAIEVVLPGSPEPVSLDQALGHLEDPDREVRQRAAGAITGALRPGVETRAFIMNNLMAAGAAGARLRRYQSWLSPTNLKNELSDGSVAMLIRAVVERYPLAQRWCAMKEGLLGDGQLAHSDRLAPVGASRRRFTLEEARRIVLGSFSGFSPAMGDAAASFFEGYIDALPRHGKRGGAYCRYLTPETHPYLSINWTGNMRGLILLSHELSHGIHVVLASGRGLFEFNPGTAVAETVSVIGELLVLETLLEETADPDERLAMIGLWLDTVMAAVFHQTALHQFEHSIHMERRNGELSVDRFAEIWLTEQAKMLGDRVDLSGYEHWWSYVPHFVSDPGSLYAYSFGQLLGLSIYERYRREGEGYTRSILDFLSAGGSGSPHELARVVGFDLDDPRLWEGGLRVIESQLDAAVTAARAAGRLMR